MARKTNLTLDEVADASIHAFCAVGYKRTQVADIARHLNAATGTLYLYAISKQALFYLAVKRLCGQSLEDETIPVRIKGFAESAQILQDAAQRLAHWPKLSAAAKSTNQVTVDQLHHIAEEAYDLLRAQQPLLRLLDANTVDIEEIRILHLEDLRATYMADLVAIVAKLPGAGAEIEKLILAARGALELMAWYAIHRKSEADKFGFPLSEDETVRPIAAEGFRAALLAAARKTGI